MALVSAIAVALFLNSCGGGADTLGHQACVDVAASIKAFNAEAAATTAAERNHLAVRAASELSAAEQPAALAAASSGSWQALQATLEEGAHGNSESNLVTALQAQCAQSLGQG